MNFRKNQLFHIFNQGNNQRQIFFKEEDYFLFLWKMHAYLLPFGKLITYALMPNHFHWQFYVQQVSIQRKTLWAHADEVEFLRRKKKYGHKARPVNRQESRKADPESLVSLNDAIGLIEASYTRAINKKYNWSGSLFRHECKALDGWIDGVLTVNQSCPKSRRFTYGGEYGLTCFHYIHDNAVEADLVEKATDWPYSSARDYAGLRNGTVCDVAFGKQLLKLP